MHVTRRCNLEKAWPERVASKYGDPKGHVLSRRYFIQNKKASGRLEDLVDVEHLEGLEDN